MLHGLCGAGATVLFDLSSPDNGTHLELGFGASYMGSLRTDDSTFDFRGAVRSFPTVGGYLAVPSVAGIRPYFGINFGIAELWNAQAYDVKGQEFGVKGQTFEYGLVGGIYRSNVFSSVGVFIEGGYRWRRFSSLDYTFPKGLETLPLPTDWRGRSTSLPGSLPLVCNSPEAEAKPLQIPGKLAADKANDQPLTGILSMQLVHRDSLVKEDVVSAVLI